MTDWLDLWDDEDTESEWYPVAEETDARTKIAVFSCPVTFGPVERDEDDIINPAWLGTAGIPPQR